MFDVTNLFSSSGGKRRHREKSVRRMAPLPPPPANKPESWRPTSTSSKQEEAAEKKAEESKPVVLQVSPELVIKHPLQHTWTLWYMVPAETGPCAKGRHWGDNQRRVASFKTCEDFWALFHHVKKASDLSVGCDLGVFKEDIQPMWEDAANKDGGRWLVNLDRPQLRDNLDRYWLEILLCMIGEGFGEEESQDICGAVFNAKPRLDRLALWTRNPSVQDRILGIGRTLKKRMGLYNLVLEYGLHSDAKGRVKSVLKV